MQGCSKSCAHYYLGFCSKYNEEILVSRNPAHPRILLHPLGYLSVYYDIRKNDISHLIDVAEKYLVDDISKSICERYKNHGSITYRQRKYIICNILNCYEIKYVIPVDYGFTQVE